MQREGGFPVLSKADGDASDVSFTVDQGPMPVSTGGHLARGIPIHSDHHGVGPHPGSLFTKLFFDLITVHPGFGFDLDVAQFDITSPGPPLEKHHMILMYPGKSGRSGIKLEAGIGIWAAGG